ncbi:MAG: histidinol-phosphatase HisJ [Kurthia sp.]|nr:histidinol-phosphatase HisJ [Candidatus Kurthia equi]
MKRDAHIHTPYCPHGTNDSFEDYIEKALKSGFTDITFTEHAPLPEGFVDPTPDKDSGMEQKYVLPYIEELQKLQLKYKEQIRIRIGFEVDFISGFEKQTTAWLNTYGPFIDDAILSVHFLKHDDTYVCIDFSDDVFLDFAEQIGSVEAVYRLYFDTVKASIKADLGIYKPKRIGHPTLVHKFQLAHGKQIDDESSIIEVLHLLSENNLEIDANSAGFAKTFCKQPYPPLPFFKLIKQLNIPIVFGSDAHQVKDLHQFAEKMQPYID